MHEHGDVAALTVAVAMAAGVWMPMTEPREQAALTHQLPAAAHARLERFL